MELFLKATSVLILIGLAFFIAAGLDPVVVWLNRHGIRRWAAVVIVILALFAFVGGFVAAAIPPVSAQTSTLSTSCQSTCTSCRTTVRRSAG